MHIQAHTYTHTYIYINTYMNSVITILRDNCPQTDNTHKNRQPNRHLPNNTNYRMDKGYGKTAKCSLHEPIVILLENQSDATLNYRKNGFFCYWTTFMSPPPLTGLGDGVTHFLVNPYGRKKVMMTIYTRAITPHRQKVMGLQRRHPPTHYLMYSHTGWPDHNTTPTQCTVTLAIRTNRLPYMVTLAGLTTTPHPPIT